MNARIKLPSCVEHAAPSRSLLSPIVFNVRTLVLSAAFDHSTTLPESETAKYEFSVDSKNNLILFDLPSPPCETLALSPTFNFDFFDDDEEAAAMAAGAGAGRGGESEIVSRRGIGAGAVRRAVEAIADGLGRAEVVEAIEVPVEGGPAEILAVIS